MAGRLGVGLAAFACIAATPATAAGWDCSNRDIAEIHCGAAGCEIERESYTPIGVSIAPAKIEICAYSGCFSGPILVRRTSGPHVVYQSRISLAGESQPVSIILDTQGRVALMRWGEFANVMRCTRS